jgi:hypothetical protein
MRIQGDSEFITAEVLFAEARAHARRRRRRVVTAIAVVGAAALAGSAALVWTNSRSQPAPNLGPSFAMTADGFPSEFVAWEPPTKGRIGGIEVISSTTGKTIRTLVKNTNHPETTGEVTNPLAYLVAGFDLTNDGHTLYYNANYTIDSVSISGGAVSHIAIGSDPMVSPNGDLLAYRPGFGEGDIPSFVQFGTGPILAIKDIATGQIRKFTVPGVKLGQAVTASWLPDSQRILIYATNKDVCGPGPGCATTTDGRHPGWSSVAKLLDVSTGEWSTVPAGVLGALRQTATVTPHLSGAASDGNAVRISATVITGIASTSVSEFTEVGTVNVATGMLRWQYRMPAGFVFPDLAELPGQDSGEHFVVTGISAQSPGLHQWSPAEQVAPQQIGATPRVLASSPYWDFA